MVKKIIKEEKTKKWWIVGNDTRGDALELSKFLFNSKEEAEDYLKTINIKTTNLRHLDVNTIKVEPVPTNGPKWDVLYDTF